MKKALGTVFDRKTLPDTGSFAIVAYALTGDRQIRPVD
jgi:hypothetical protein